MILVTTLYIKDKKILLYKNKESKYDILTNIVDLEDTPLESTIKYTKELFNNNICDDKFSFIKTLRLKDRNNLNYLNIFKYDEELDFNINDNIKYIYYDTKCDLEISDIVKKDILPYLIENNIIN